MGKKQFMMGNEALAEAAIRAGCKMYAGYPITPSTEIIEYMAKHLPERGGVCIQSESELAGINMLSGAASVGARCMTASSGLGISLMCEGFSHMSAIQLPAVIVNQCRGGPGAGHLGPSQGDYYQATKGGGHGEYRMIVLGPSTVQETVELTMLAFHLADKYRNLVMILGDSVIAHLMESVEFPEPISEPLPPKDYINTGARGRPPIKMIISDVPTQHRVGEPEIFEDYVLALDAKYKRIAANETRVEVLDLDGADLILVAYGSAARLAKQAISDARKEGIKVGLIRPITLWPFPSQAIADAAGRGIPMLTVELSTGQMVDDVRLAVAGKVPVSFWGRTGGIYPTPAEILAAIRRTVGNAPAATRQ